MRKVFYAILCLFKNIKSAIHCKILANDLDIDFDKTYWNCEMLSTNAAFHLIGLGIEPVEVSYSKSDANDHFYFIRTPKMLEVLADYHKALNVSVENATWDDLTAIYDVPGHEGFYDDPECVNYPFQPHGHARERFAYLSWPAEMREKYINSSADSRREMISAAYGRG